MLPVRPSSCSGIVVFAFSGDLPFGRLSAPGAGMMPKLLIGLMIAFGLALIARRRTSPPFAADRLERPLHALLVVVIAAVAIAPTSGSASSSRCRCWCSRCSRGRSSASRCCSRRAYSVGLTVFAYWLFGKALKAPLEHGILGF